MDSEENSKTTCGRATKNWAVQKVRPAATKKFWLRKFPFINFLRHYNGDFLLSDVIAGLTVGLSFMPSAMASAAVAGLPPQYGLYATISCYLLYGIFGSEAHVIIGPTVVAAIICIPYVEKFGPEAAFTLSFYSGIIATALGVFNLGFVADFISTPVLKGFLSAASATAFAGQVSKLLGLSGGGSTFVEYMVNIVDDLINEGPKLWDSVLGFSCIIFIAIFKYLQRYSDIPDTKKVSVGEKVLRRSLYYLGVGSTAIAVLISTIIVGVIVSSGAEPPVNIAGNVTSGLPKFVVPPFTLEYNNQTLGFVETLKEFIPALSLPLLIVMEAIATAKAFAFGRSVDTVQEFLASGFINVFGSFIQAIPSTGSVSRTTVNYKAGVKTPLGCIFAGILTLLAVGALSDQLQYLPDPALAAVVITSVAVIFRIHFDTIDLWRCDRLDLVPLYITFVSCLLLGIDWGIIIGVLTNMILILVHAAKPQVEVEKCKIQNQRVMVATPDRNISYPGSPQIRKLIMKPLRYEKPGIIVVIDGIHITKLDYTSIKVFRSIVRDIKLRGNEVIFWRWSEAYIKKFEEVHYDCDQSLHYIVETFTIQERDQVSIAGSETI